ncbi:GDP-mannose transporter GONST1-like [Micractinium conductrix]|uniref:GDP-mannose transporter GONST1-like n=1 Tax=Micractinium conductrix TaxID=554055 RepID=A0A2P6VPC0_9CHLO|nr:GDP-mannose transporter GONST1-like [Micractinium conductrix]|eukprot:PSC75907.1 GDP-mannose transporter GONST1-like [Micractinium conductrix]
MKPSHTDEEAVQLLGSKQDAKVTVAALDVDAAKKARHIAGVPAAILAGLCYVIASIAMILLNKTALSSFNFESINSLLFFQCALSVVLVQMCNALGLIDVEPLNPKIVRIWLPVNVLFVGMLGTSFMALRTLNVAMVQVLKNLSNLFTLCGDYYFFGRTYKANVWACVALMMLSAICGGITDLSFDATGYCWQIVNCVFNSSFQLYLRGAMDRVSTHTTNGEKLSGLSMVFYNNLLSLPFLAAMILITGKSWGCEGRSVWAEPDLNNHVFLSVAALSGFIGFGLSFASLWFLSTTTPSIYSLVGSLNQVPVAAIGMIAFSVPWTTTNLLSIGVGATAAVLFAYAKSKQ